jgi:hypothetical protein
VEGGERKKKGRRKKKERKTNSAEGRAELREGEGMHYCCH